MKPKNVMLLGFVNKAVKYLDQHLDDGSSSKISELRNIDLENIKNDLSHNIDQSLGVAQSTINTLLQIGEDVFDEFLSVHDDSDKLSTQLDRMFDISLDDNQEKNDQNDLEDLLSFYNLDSSFNLDEDDLLQEDLNGDGEVNDEDTNYIEIFNIKDYEKNNAHSTNINTLPIDHVDDYDDKDTKYVEVFNLEKYLQEHANKEYTEAVYEDESDEEAVSLEEDSEKQLEDYFEKEADDAEDEAVINEETISVEDDEKQPEDYFEKEVDDAEYEVEEESEFELSNEDMKLLQLIEDNVNKTNEPETISDEIGEDKHDSQELDSIFSEVVAHEDETEEDLKEENQVPDQIDHTDIIKLLQEIQVSDDQYYGNIEDFTIEDQFPFEDEEEYSEQIDEEPNIEEDNTYVSSLIEDLRKQMIQEDEEKKVREEEYKQIYDRIHKLYPYISNDFIRTVYDLKDSITYDYPLNKRIIILHRCVFKDVENLRQFVEIGLNHGYSINADENKMIVDIFKEHINTDGKILSSIFEVANQSALLNGQYDGYRVMLVEKV